MNSPSILIIDDEPDNFDVIETLLSVGSSSTVPNLDYVLHYAASGPEALANLDAFNPDLILMDVMMPKMDGIELCRQIKALSKWRTVPIVMVTALSSKSDLASCLAAGADDFIAKPVNALELRARVQSMLRIRQQYQDLQSLLKFRADMVNMIVHDLRNPLGTIQISSDLLARPGYPQEKHASNLAHIQTSAQELQELINDLLQIALCESGNIRLNFTKIDLCKLVQSAIASFEAIAAQRNQLFISQFSESNLYLEVDATMLRRVLDNLLSNAIKCSRANNPIIVNVDPLPSGYARIQVVDFGPGVPEPLQQKIFEKYEIGNPMPNVAQIGLGLAFCKMVVEAHGGTICVKNNHPKGAIFEILLTL